MVCNWQQSTNLFVQKESIDIDNDSDFQPAQFLLNNTKKLS